MATLPCYSWWLKNRKELSLILFSLEANMVNIGLDRSESEGRWPTWVGVFRASVTTGKWLSSSLMMISPWSPSTGICCPLGPLLALKVAWVLACLISALSPQMRLLLSLVTCQGCSRPWDQARGPPLSGEGGTETRGHESLSGIDCKPASSGWGESELSK